MLNQYTFFWCGPFSQWYPSQFEDDDCDGERTLHFNCAEQYMMYWKAILFGNQRIAEEILKEPRASRQQALGRTVKRFDQEAWDKVKEDVVFNGNVLKYDQNHQLYTLLAATQGTTLVEASPKDTIWGIGLSEDDPRCLDRTQWLGQNLLGKVLTEVREHLVYCELKMMPPKVLNLRNLSSIIHLSTLEPIVEGSQIGDTK